MEEATQGKISEDKIKLFLLAIMLTNIVAMINTSTVNIALPTYMRIFHVDISAVGGDWLLIAIGHDDAAIRIPV